MSGQPGKKKYTNMGTMMVSKKKDENDPNEPKRYYIRLEQQKGKDKKPFGEVIFPITLANGVVLNDGDILSMFAKRPKFQKMVDEGKMTQEKADELSAFLAFDIVLTEDPDAPKSSSGGNGDINF